MRTGGLYISFSFLHLPPDRITKRRTRWKSKYSGIDQKVENSNSDLFASRQTTKNRRKMSLTKFTSNARKKCDKVWVQAHVLIAVNQIETKSGQVTKIFFGTRKSKISVGNAYLNSNTKHNCIKSKFVTSKPIFRVSAAK